MSAPDPIPAAPDRRDPGAAVYCAAAALVLGLLIYHGYMPRGESRPSELVAAGLDVNRADAAELEQLPGFGPKRAQAVVTHRTNYGPIPEGQSLETVPGVGPGTAARAQAFLIPPTETLTRKPAAPPAAAGKIRRGEPAIDINAAGEMELLRLPGVGKTLAARIVDARPFVSIDDLRRVKGVGAKTLEGLRPFVAVSASGRP